MALKRKRDTTNTSTLLGSPPKRQKSLSNALQNVQLSPTKQSNDTPISQQHACSPPTITDPNIPNQAFENDMDGDDEEDSDMNLEYATSINTITYPLNNDNGNGSGNGKIRGKGSKHITLRKRKKLKRRKNKNTINKTNINLPLTSSTSMPIPSSSYRTDKADRDRDIDRNRNRNRKSNRLECKEQENEQQSTSTPLRLKSRLSITQSLCHSTDDPSNHTSNESPIKLFTNTTKSKSTLNNPSPSVLLTSPPQRRFITSSTPSIRRPLPDVTNHNNSPPRIKIMQPNNGKINNAILREKLEFLSPSPSKTIQQSKRGRKKKKRVWRQNNYHKRSKSMESRKQSLFWQEIKQIGILVPPPAADLCDRHLMIIHMDSIEAMYHTQTQNEDESENKEPSEDDGDLSTLSTPDSVHGLDSDSPNAFEHDLLKDEKVKLNQGSKDLLQSMDRYKYRIIKIANFALSIKSEYFRNLLSKKSKFVESEENLIPIKIHKYYAFSFELLIRLLHIDHAEIDKYLFRIQNHRTLLQLLVLIDQFQIRNLDEAVLKRLQFMASRPRPKFIQFPIRRPSPKPILANNHSSSGSNTSYTLPLSSSNSNSLSSNRNNSNNHSDKENINYRNEDPSNLHPALRRNQSNRQREIPDFENDDNVLKEIKLTKNENESDSNEYNGDIQHIIPDYDASFDNGGMTLLEVSDLLAIGSAYLCLSKCRQIAKKSLRKRYRSMKFNKHGLVELEFRKLPSEAINIILKGNDFTSFNENDVFLACAQWAAYPLHVDDDKEMTQNNNNKKDRYSMNPNDNRKHIVRKRFNEVWDCIRYHFIDRWFLDTIVKNYGPIQSNNNALLKLLNVTSKASLCFDSSSNEIISGNPRYKDITHYFKEHKPPRDVPGHDKNDNDDNPQPFQDWESFGTLCLTENDLRNKYEIYDKFEIIFNKQDLVNLHLGQRITSCYMVWRGIIFALDLVRKEHTSQRRDGVGVFLYCQGLEPQDHIWIRYSLKTLGHDHALQCSDYKMMQLNFQKGNGSRDFFNCSWDDFLNTFFDNNDQLRFRLTFIACK